MLQLIAVNTAVMEPELFREFLSSCALGMRIADNLITMLELQGRDDEIRDVASWKLKRASRWPLSPRTTGSWHFTGLTMADLQKWEWSFKQ